jgi:hypothetical protein
LILGKPLFPGRNVSHQLQLITNLVGTPMEEQLAKVKTLLGWAPTGASTCFSSYLL